MTTETETYNGWANYETWNVALWIGNDETLYRMAVSASNRGLTYAEFARSLMDDGCEETADGVGWDAGELDHVELDAMMDELTA